MTDEEKRDRIQELWGKARDFVGKMRREIQIAKIEEHTYKDRMIDAINEDDDSEVETDLEPKLAWYLIDSDKTFCKTWDFIVVMFTIYPLFVSPFILVFPEVYQTCILPDNFKRDNCKFVTKS